MMMLHFQLVFKSVSSREAHHGPGKSTAHEGRTTESKINRTWKTGGLDKVGFTRVRVDMGRTLEEGPV